MKKGARSNAAKTAGVAGAGAASRIGQQKAMTEREEQEQVVQLAAQLAFLRATTTQTEEQKAARQTAQLAFLKAGLEEYQSCNAMGKEGVVDEYRRAGKLHTYDPYTEKQKRFARVANLYPCPWSEHMVERIKEYTKYLEEDEDNYKIGLYSLIEE